MAGSARFQQSRRVLLPGLLIEIHGEKPTGFVTKQRIGTKRLLARKMVVNRFIS
jgi:hypothetical protein